MNFNTHDFEYERRRKQLSNSQPGFNWWIVGAIGICAVIWGLALTANKWAPAISGMIR